MCGYAVWLGVGLAASIQLHNESAPTVRVSMVETVCYLQPQTSQNERNPVSSQIFSHCKTSLQWLEIEVNI